MPEKFKFTPFHPPNYSHTRTHAHTRTLRLVISPQFENCLGHLQVSIWPWTKETTSQQRNQPSLRRKKQKQEKLRHGQPVCLKQTLELIKEIKLSIMVFCLFFNRAKAGFLLGHDEHLNIFITWTPQAWTVLGGWGGWGEKSLLLS